MKKKVLWISFRVPYDAVRHAGGKIHNYYLKSLHKTGDYDIRLISFVKTDDEGKVDLDAYGIENDLIHYACGRGEKLVRAVMNRLAKPWMLFRNGLAMNAFEEYSVCRKIRKSKAQGYEPEVILLQWTQMVLLAPKLRKLFPQAKLVAIEEDVLFLSHRRRMEMPADLLHRQLNRIKYRQLKKQEIACLSMCDLAILNNPKDEQLVREEGVEHTWYWTPYFQSMLEVKRQKANHDILFYGAMYREENWRSAVWFIENVFPRLADTDVRLCIIGHNPPEILQRYRSDRIVVEGYVEDLTQYFAGSMCLVAPLVLGAGVKIKVIEGLSAGIPVLTNTIGIEGIPAENGKEYFFCETPEEYETMIRALARDVYDFDEIEACAKGFVGRTYDMNRDAAEFAARIGAL